MVLFLRISRFSLRLSIRQHRANHDNCQFSRMKMSRKATAKSTKITSLENLGVYGNHGMYSSVNSSSATPNVWHKAHKHK